MRKLFFFQKEAHPSIPKEIEELICRSITVGELKLCCLIFCSPEVSDVDRVMQMVDLMTFVGISKLVLGFGEEISANCSLQLG